MGKEEVYCASMGGYVQGLGGTLLGQYLVTVLLEHYLSEFLKAGLIIH